ncbi:mutS domain I family protein, partial [Vibrio parahaemolyticus V-223/04]
TVVALYGSLNWIQPNNS